MVKALRWAGDLRKDLGFKLGRGSAVTMPRGTRSYSYADADQRLLCDAFTAVAASGYAIERVYGDEIEFDGYDEVGNLVEVQGGSSEPGDPVVGATYSYDRRNRLSSWQRQGGVAEHYSYDPLGNLVGYATGSADQENQAFGEQDGSRPHAVTSSMASGSVVGFTYDADGNRASAIGGGASRYYRFDWASRLVGVGTTPGGTGMLATTYAASGSRVSEWTTAGGLRVFMGEHVTLRRGEATPPGFEAMQIRIFAFGETLAVKHQDPVTLRTAGIAGWLPLPDAGRWVPWVGALLLVLMAGGLVVLLVRLEFHVPLLRHPAASGAAWALVVLIAVPPLPAGGGGGGGMTLRRWLVTDHLGSGVVWLDMAGARLRHTEYAPFGKIDAEVAPGGGGLPTIYAGHRRETVTGLDYMQARWYSADTGAFLSVDPLVGDSADPQAFNAYAYARNNPVAHIDPTGEIWEGGGFGPLGIATWGGVPPGLSYLWGVAGGGGAASAGPPGSGPQIVIVERDGRPEIVFEDGLGEPLTIADLLSAILGGIGEDAPRSQEMGATEAVRGSESRTTPESVAQPDRGAQRDMIEEQLEELRDRRRGLIRRKIFLERVVKPALSKVGKTPLGKLGAAGAKTAVEERLLKIKQDLDRIDELIEQRERDLEKLGGPMASVADPNLDAPHLAAIEARLWAASICPYRVGGESARDPPAVLAYSCGEAA